MLRDIQWVYPFLMAFVQEKMPNDPSQYRYAELFYDDLDKCIEEFYNYICKIHTPIATPEQLERLKLLKEEQITGWFDAAITARDLKFNQDYAIEADIVITTSQGTKFASEAKLIVDSRLDKRSKYSFGVHQCLHAKLNMILADMKKGEVVDANQAELNEALSHCTKPFHIEDEKQIIYTSSSKTLLNDYDHGTFYAVTGTAGSKNERQEAAMLYASPNPEADINPDAKPVEMAFIEVPRHKALKRVDLPVRLVANDKQEAKFIVMEILASRARNQPTMIVCANDAECHRIVTDVKKYLAKHPEIMIENKEMLVVDSMTDMHQENGHIKNDIGRANMITFTTPKLGRGVDIPIHGDAKAFGLKVIPTGSMMRHRDYYQVIARAGRFGAPGESRVILNKSRVKTQLNKKTLTDGYYTAPQTYIRREQAIIDRRKQVQRLIKFAFVDFRSTLQKALYGDLQYKLPANGRAVMRRLWQGCSTQLDQKWNEIYERIVHELQHDTVNEAALNILLQEMHEFTRRQWTQLHSDLSQNRAISIAHANNKCMDSLIKDVPEFKLAPNVLGILKNYSLEESVQRVTPIYDKYDPAHDGHAAIYRSRFEKWRATFAGERRIFADIRAWWNGRGILFANIRAWWNGDLTFKQLILGGAGEPRIMPVVSGSSSAGIITQLGGTKAAPKTAPAETTQSADNKPVDLPPTTSPTMFAGNVASNDGMDSDVEVDIGLVR